MIFFPCLFLICTVLKPVDPQLQLKALDAPIITEWSGLEGTSVGHLVQPPAEAGSPTAGCTGPCPGGS